MTGRKLVLRFALLGVFSVAALAAKAQVIFNNVVITGTLSTGASFATGPTFIDFNLPSARVGDGELFRSGNVTITYNATTSGSIFADDILLEVFGALSGSGQIFFNEIIEDLSDPNNPVVIGTHNVNITSNNQLPYIHHLVFDHPSNNIRVKKELTLTANPDTQGFDFSAVGLVQQTMSLVPEPGSMIALGAGLASLAALRRKKK